jgi:hypothetical protein
LAQQGARCGFEDALADLQAAKEAEAKRQLDALTSALVGMFNAMGRSFMQRNFEFMNPPVVGRTVKSFLERFDAIFTVNQDTLLEHHYMPTVMGSKVERLPNPWHETTRWKPHPRTAA